MVVSMEHVLPHRGNADGEVEEDLQYNVRRIVKLSYVRDGRSCVPPIALIFLFRRPWRAWGSWRGCP